MVQRTNHVDGHYFRPLIESGLKLASAEKVVVDGQVIGDDWPPVLFLTIAADGDLVLPTPSDRTRGLTFFINNIDAAFDIDLESPADTIIQTVLFGESYILHCDGVTWRVIG